MTDSIKIDMNNLSFEYYGIQRIERETSILKKATCNYRESKTNPRTENNPHGLIITDWKTILNKDLDYKVKKFLMKLFKHKRMIEKKISRLKTEQATVILLTKIFQRFGVNNACERLLAWQTYTIKAMFGITISFLSLVTFLSIVMRPSENQCKFSTKKRTKIQISIDSSLQKKQIGVGDLLEVIKMQNEINELRKNGKLTPETLCE